MPKVTLQAHYDGEKVVLDEPVDLPADIRLLVTVLPTGAETPPDDEAAWLRAIASNDAFADLADKAEDIYTAEDSELSLVSKLHLGTREE